MVTLSKTLIDSSGVKREKTKKSKTPFDSKFELLSIILIHFLASNAFHYEILTSRPAATFFSNLHHNSCLSSSSYFPSISSSSPSSSSSFAPLSSICSDPIWLNLSLINREFFAQITNNTRKRGISSFLSVL